MKNKKVLLLEIANCIVSNIKSIPNNGLFKGKLGVSVFLFEYYRYSNVALYQDIAKQLLNEVHNEFKSSRDTSVSNGLPGYALCLLYLYNRGFIKLDKGLLIEIESRFIDNPRGNLLNEMTQPIQLFSSFVYLAYKAQIFRDVDYQYVDRHIKTISWFTDILPQIDATVIKPHLFYSMQRCLTKLGSMIDGSTKEEIDSRINHSLEVLNRKQNPNFTGAVDVKSCVFNNILCFEKIISNKEINESLFDSYWCDFVFNDTFTDDNESIVAEIVHLLIDQQSFYINSINNYLSILGIKLLKH